MKKLIKSYKFWAALAGAVGMLFVAINDTLGISINAKGAEEIIFSICGILIVFGVVKKPDSNKTNTKAPEEIDVKQQNNEAQNLENTSKDKK